MTLRMIKWSDELSVAIPAIDEDHRKLLGLLNKVIAACYAGVGAGVVETALKQLDAYTRDHFGREEALLEQGGYPDFSAHHRRHQALIDQLATIRSDHLGGEVMEFLHNWLINHIMKDDQHYATYFKDRREH